MKNRIGVNLLKPPSQDSHPVVRENLNLSEAGLGTFAYEGCPDSIE